MALDPESGVGTGHTAPINTDASRRKSSGRRKSSAVVDIPTEHIDTKNLSDADKRLAEMGYVQVSPSPISLPSHDSLPNCKEYQWSSKAYIAPRAPFLGLQAGILLAVLHLLRPLHLRSFRLRRHHLRLPSRSGWSLVRRLVLAAVRLRLLLHCPLRRRARLRLPNLRRPLLHLQISRA